jgi:diguanylate cyclase (GGDEF)-like protein
MVASSLRTGKALTLLVIDADHFKSINDRFGHSEGDRVLKMIAEVLVRAVGTDDKVFRIGGEEFAILCAFPHALGRLLGESIRQSVVAAGRTRATPCSVSVGVATVGSQVGSLADLFALADQRLYAAKTDGRDRVVGDAAPGRPQQAWQA